MVRSFGHRVQRSEPRVRGRRETLRKGGEGGLAGRLGLVQHVADSSAELCDARGLFGIQGRQGILEARPGQLDLLQIRQGCGADLDPAPHGRGQSVEDGQMLRA